MDGFHTDMAKAAQASHEKAMEDKLLPLKALIVYAIRNAVPDYTYEDAVVLMTQMLTRHAADEISLESISTIIEEAVAEARKHVWP